MKESKKVLLFGGGKIHDFNACCPVLEEYLKSIDNFAINYIAEDLDVFRSENMKEYDILVLYNTGGDLNIEQKRGLVEWCAEGGAFAGIHAAADSFRNSPEYLAMVGGVLKAHPFRRNYIVGLNNEHHPALGDMRGYSVKDWEKWPVFEYEVHDEQYLLNYDNRVSILASTLFRGRLWPVSWIKDWGKGKVFYLALGHNVEGCRNPFFKDLFMSGIKWISERRPEPPVNDNRFAIS